MEEVANKSSRSMTKDVSELVDTYIALAKANVTQKAAEAASVSALGVITAVLACFTILFAGLALGWWIGQLIASMPGGFLIVAGLFGLTAVLLFAFKEKLLYRVIRNTIVKKVYE